MTSFERIAFARRMLREPDCRVPRDRNDCTRALAPERTPSRLRPGMRIAGLQVGLMDRGRVRPRPQCVAPQPNRRGSFRSPVGSAGVAGQRASSLPCLVRSGNRGGRMVAQCSNARGDHRQADLPNRLAGRLETLSQASWGAADLRMMELRTEIQQSVPLRAGGTRTRSCAVYWRRRSKQEVRRTGALPNGPEVLLERVGDSRVL